jgi:hypothetical protein
MVVFASGVAQSGNDAFKFKEFEFCYISKSLLKLKKAIDMFALFEVSFSERTK